ncbi:hypothetical protein C464_16407 [Halorubrum coriense DSM 10284]|uniref:Uncharacterized protein n=1 Tax=Halorubrum coriense DSM 10284 TaxID=1227466 RepID=M0E8H8_9EURY|nr:hypothetical protein C464_16407 [Halorubrum coriense DSM 10284]
MNPFVFWPPLPSSAGPLVWLPLVIQQEIYIFHIPVGWGLSPRPLDTACNRVGALALTILVFPAEALLFDRRCFGFSTKIFVRVSAMYLSKRMSASTEGNSFLIVHRHPIKGLAYVLRRL